MAHPANDPDHPAVPAGVEGEKRQAEAAAALPAAGPASAEARPADAHTADAHTTNAQPHAAPRWSGPDADAGNGRPTEDEDVAGPRDTGGGCNSNT